MARQRSLGMLNIGVIDRLRLGWRLLRDPRVPAWPKWVIPASAVIYLFSPVDLIPDFFLGIGQLDDLSFLAVAVASVAMLMRWAPQEIVHEHAYDLGLEHELPTTPEAGRTTTTGTKKQQAATEAKYWVDDWK